MSAFYSIDSTRVSHREYWWGNRSPLVVFSWLFKWLRVSTPSSTDDPNVEAITPFLGAALPGEVAQRFAGTTGELSALGFGEPIFHVIHDPGTATTIYWATFRHSSGQHFARIHQRIWQQVKPADRGTFVMFFTPFADGTFIGSSSGKPDLATPATVRMVRQRGATPTMLWTTHLEFVAARRQADFQPMRTREELIAATERHHVLLRDFNLKRGVFRPRTTVEQATATAVGTRLQEATASGFRHPGVLAEVERIQTQRPGWGNAVVILVVSLLAFAGAGAADRDWQLSLGLIPLLFFHESGHWLAMKIFGYRNLRMFFIPLFGAAVTGRHWNVPGWKKALVALAGPVPGIALGVVLAVLELREHRAWLNQAAFLLLFINGFNLLPVLPLDGGNVLHAVLFCRNRWLDLAFRVTAIACLLVLGGTGVSKFFLYLGIMMGIGLPVAYKVGKVTDVLRGLSLPPPLPGEDRIPLPTADTIATALKAQLPGNTNDKTLAQQTVNVFETLNAKPPGALGTLAFLGVHGGSLLLAVIFAGLVIVNKDGDWLQNIGRRARSPGVIQKLSYSAPCNSTIVWTGRTAATVPARSVLVANWSDAAAARSQFNALTNRLPATATLTHLGHSLLLTLPPGDEAARERWFTELNSATTNTFVALTNQTLGVAIVGTVPDRATATNLALELNQYFFVANLGELVPPWSPKPDREIYTAKRDARRTWLAIGTNTVATWNDPKVKDINRQIQDARKRGAKIEIAGLIAMQGIAADVAKAGIYERLKLEGFDSELVDLHAKLQAVHFTNRIQRVELQRRIAGKLGPVPGNPRPPGEFLPRHAATGGWVRSKKLLVEITWVKFQDLPTGLPVLLDWLCAQGCTDLKYDLRPPRDGDDNDDDEG